MSRERRLVCLKCGNKITVYGNAEAKCRCGMEMVEELFGKKQKERKKGRREYGQEIA